MPLPEPDLDGELVGLFYVAWIDIDGDPVRATTLPYGYEPTGTGDADLDGFEFLGLDHQLVSISPVAHGKGGSDTVTATLRGLPGSDEDLTGIVDTEATWKGRICRLWYGTHVAGVAASIAPYYTGYLNKLTDTFIPQDGDEPASRTVSVEIENYLAVLTAARNRTYAQQAEHDSGDLSAQRMRSAANGNMASAIVSGGQPANPDRQYVQLQ